MVKTNKEGGWYKADDKGYGGETQLQEMLAKYPDLIPIEDLGDDRKPIKVTVREADNTDLIGVDEDGNITIIETKLAYNPEIKREVIGQILEYASKLWENSYEDFDSTIHNIMGEHLQDLMEAKIGNGEGWSSDDFRIAVGKNLKEGSFALFIIVDVINDELRQTISYINSRCPDVFVLYALELKYFHEKGVEIILPKLYGVAAGKTKAKASYIQWDEEKFFKDVKERLNNNAEQLNAIKKLYKFSIDNTTKIGWGRGETGSFNPKFEKISARSLYTVRTDGFLYVTFGWLDDNETTKKYRDMLREQMAKITKGEISDNRYSISFRIEKWVPIVDKLIAAFTNVINS